MANQFTGSEPVARLEAGHGLMRHMAPERNERRAAFGFMFQRDQPAIAKRHGLDLDAPDGRRERRVDWRACGHEKVEAQMVDTPLAFDKARTERFIGINRTLFSPRPEAKLNVITGAEIIPPRRRRFRAPPCGIDRHHMRRITIRHQRLGECGRVRFYDRCKSPAVGIEPCADSTCPFHRIETAGFTQDCGRKTRVQGVEPVQQAPCRCFADREIGIVPGLFAARGRQRHAGHKPHGNQVEEDIYFLRLKREFLMKTGSKGASRANRIIHIENGIGAGNCNLCNQHRMDSIPEIDQPGNALAVIVIHQHIPVIGIIVDHLRAQKRKLRSDIALETRKEVLDHRAVFRLVDEMQALTRPACMAQIPIEIPQRTRMYEALQGTIEFAHCTAQIFEKRFRALPFRKRRSGEPACHAQCMRLAVRALRGSKNIA